MRKTAEMMEGTHKRQRVEPPEKVGQCAECRQPGELNHRGVCDYCDDPYGKSALASFIPEEGK